MLNDYFPEFLERFWNRKANLVDPTWKSRERFRWIVDWLLDEPEKNDEWKYKRKPVLWTQENWDWTFDGTPLKLNIDKIKSDILMEIDVTWSCQNPNQLSYLYGIWYITDQELEENIKRYIKKEYIDFLFISNSTEGNKVKIDSLNDAQKLFLAYAIHNWLITKRKATQHFIFWESGIDSFIREMLQGINNSKEGSKNVMWRCKQALLTEWKLDNVWEINSKGMFNFFEKFWLNDYGGQEPCNLAIWNPLIEKPENDTERNRKKWMKKLEYDIEDMLLVNDKETWIIHPDFVNAFLKDNDSNKVRLTNWIEIYLIKKWIDFSTIDNLKVDVNSLKEDERIILAYIVKQNEIIKGKTEEEEDSYMSYYRKWLLEWITLDYNNYPTNDWTDPETFFNRRYTVGNIDNMLLADCLYLLQTTWKLENFRAGNILRRISSDEEHISVDPEDLRQEYYSNRITPEIMRRAVDIFFKNRRDYYIGVCDFSIEELTRLEQSIVVYLIDNKLYNPIFDLPVGMDKEDILAQYRIDNLESIIIKSFLENWEIKTEKLEWYSTELKNILSEVSDSTQSFWILIEKIEDSYDYTPCFFTVWNKVNTPWETNFANWSLKIFAFAKMYWLDKEQTLSLFCEYYKEVLDTPDDKNHPNIREFMRVGWEWVIIHWNPLVPKES